MSTKAADMGVRSVHQSKPIGAIPPKPTPAQMKQKPAPKRPTSPPKRGK